MTAANDARAIDLLVHGGTGRMGRAVIAAAPEFREIRLAGILDPRGAVREPLEHLPVFEHIPVGERGAPVVVDFSRADAIGPLVGVLRGTGARLVSGTTGLAEKDRILLQEYSKDTAVVYDENMSYGVSVLRALLRMASGLLRDADVEIVEFHHRGKKDHPSGTTFALARAIDPDAVVTEGRAAAGGTRRRVIRSHSARLGGVPGEHQVYFATDDEVVTISHRALTRDAFAKGAIRAVLFVAGKAKGLYTAEDVARA
jgi:4-hydroxy-tetrahydrodipicolinate reductase